MKKLIMFVVLSLLCSSALCSDPPINYFQSYQNIYGGKTYYQNGQPIGRTIPNNTGSHTYYGKSGVEYRGFGTKNGTRWQASPQRKDTKPSSKPSPKTSPSKGGKSKK